MRERDQHGHVIGSMAKSSTESEFGVFLLLLLLLLLIIVDVVWWINPCCTNIFRSVLKASTILVFSPLGSNTGFMYTGADQQTADCQCTIKSRRRSSMESVILMSPRNIPTMDKTRWLEKSMDAEMLTIRDLLWYTQSAFGYNWELYQWAFCIQENSNSVIGSTGRTLIKQNRNRHGQPNLWECCDFRRGPPQTCIDENQILRL